MPVLISLISTIAAFWLAAQTTGVADQFWNWITWPLAIVLGIVTIYEAIAFDASDYFGG